jgi:hypothetical protein
VRCATHPDSDRSLVAQFRGHHSLGIVKERDERLGGLPGIVGVVAKPRFYLQAEGDASQIQIQSANGSPARGIAYLDEELDLAANVDEIQVGVEAEDVDAAAGAPGVEDDGVLVGPGRAGPPGAGRGAGGQARHEEEHEGDERERGEDDEQDAPVAVRAVGQRLLAAAVGQRGVAAHLGVGGEEQEVRGRGRAVADAAAAACGGRGRLRRRRVGRLLLRGIQRSASGRAARASVVDLLRLRRGVGDGRKTRQATFMAYARRGYFELTSLGFGNWDRVAWAKGSAADGTRKCEPPQDLPRADKAQGSGEMQREEARAGWKVLCLPKPMPNHPRLAVAWCVETGGFGMRRRFYTGPDRAATVRAAPAAARPDFAVLAPVASAFWEARIVLN